MIPPRPDGPIAELAFAFALLAICVAVHAAGLIGLGSLLKVDAEQRPHFWKDVWLLIRLAWGMIMLHVLEIIIWAFFYHWKDCVPDLSTAFYFSATTYTTVGYGDVVLGPEWRNLCSFEALTGILMSGLSTGFFFMILNRVFGGRLHLR